MKYPSEIIFTFLEKGGGGGGITTLHKISTLKFPLYVVYIPRVIILHHV